MSKILILGNSGSGKSYAAKRLSEFSGIPATHLDKIFWEPGGCNIKRSRDLVRRDLDQAKDCDSWIIEGCFGDLIKYCAPVADLLLFLDLPWHECESNLKARGYEPEKWSDQDLGRRQFSDLLTWASGYWSRNDKFSRSYHSDIYDSHSTAKVRLVSSHDVNKWLSSWLK